MIIGLLTVGTHLVDAGASLYDVVVANPQLSMIVQAMKDAGFAELVQQKGT